jgi:pimeloyl-ACP methyl ester carboxylesterase
VAKSSRAPRKPKSAPSPTEPRSDSPFDFLRRARETLGNTTGDTQPDNAFAHFADQLKAPGAFLVALESRAPFELGATLATWPLLKTAPSGDGHAVIVFPGLGAGDFSTVPLRNFLSTQGYDTYGWDLGFNFGPRDGVLKKSVERVMEIHETTGRTVSLIGWSLGGLYAREFAKALPKHVRSVITLGTPFAGDPKATNAWRFYEFVSGHKLDDKKMLAHLKEAPRVPTTSIFSRTDGVVAWPLSLQRESKTAENIEVVASHIGLGMNPIALYAVADRLAQLEGQWQKFDRAGWRRHFYRDPHRDQDSIL